MIAETTTQELADNWWLPLLRGICGVAFGVLCAVWPIPSLLALVILYGVYMLFDGGFAHELIEVGKADARARADEIREFFG